MSETTTSAMPAVIHRILFTGFTEIPPGDSVDSREIDVSVLGLWRTPGELELSRASQALTWSIGAGPP
jgi:hypothetical protein